MTPAPPELAALLAASRARPADDLPRLVLADWLDENGQPERAEFVRVQVEVSHPTADGERMAALKKREADLLTEHEGEWTGGYAAAVEALRQPPPLRFVRGLIRLGDAANALDHRAFRGWLRSPGVAWVEHVGVSVSSVSWFVKADLPDELHGRIGLTLGELAGLTQEATLRYQFRNLAASGNFAAVRSLAVRRAVGEVVLDEITQADVSNLVAVSVEGYDSTRTAGLVASAPFTSLSALDVGRVSEAGVRLLAASPHLGNLTHLNLLASPIGDAGMAALCRSRLAHTLRRVEFPNTDLGDDGVIALAGSPLLAHLHGPRLNLMMNRIGDDGLKALAASEHLLRFRELVLRENAVGDAGVEALAASPFAANLQFLDFWRNRLTDRGAFALAASPHLNKVLDLSVKENAVTPAGAAALHERFGERAKV